MRLVGRKDMYVESIVPQGSDMSYSERTLGECQKAGPGGQMSHFRKLLHLSTQIIKVDWVNEAYYRHRFGG